MCDEHDVKTPEDYWTPGAFSEVENAEPPNSGSRALGVLLILSIMFWCAVITTIVLLTY